MSASRTLAGLVTAADGRALIITNRQDEDGSDANDEQVQAAVRPPGGAFGPLEEVSGAQDHPLPQRLIRSLEVSDRTTTF